MNGNHAAGGSLGFLIGVVAARYGFNVSDTEAGVIGGALLAVGGVIAHILTGPGMKPALKRAWNGPARPVDPPVPAPPVEPAA